MASGLRSYAIALAGDNPARTPFSIMFPQRYHDVFAVGVDTGFLKKASRKDGMEHLMQMFGGLGASGNLGIASNPDVPPEELYATQLSQLQEMGFFDTQENIRALIATAGNVHAAVERLLGSLGH